MDTKELRLMKIACIARDSCDDCPYKDVCDRSIDEHIEYFYDDFDFKYPNHYNDLVSAICNEYNLSRHGVLSCLCHGRDCYGCDYNDGCSCKNDSIMSKYDDFWRLFSRLTLWINEGC